MKSGLLHQAMPGFFSHVFISVKILLSIYKYLISDVAGVPKVCHILLKTRTGTLALKEYSADLLD